MSINENEEFILSRCFNTIDNLNVTHNLGLDEVEVYKGTSFRFLALLNDHSVDCLPTHSRWDYIMSKYRHVVDSLNGPHGLTVLRALILRYNERRLNEEAKAKRMAP